eukprot:TRINITY_DN7107_c0_g2_i1.p1 TRINITY_DN7107_c0_g2~~TRINITY_DN7107_c0_g2_i1.p1  ORF type:complete len:343 (+),score=32.84 TRINITY_DN7107_c0_g2_i1:418-1446(+)
MEGQSYSVYVRKRPGVDKFLRILSEMYELVIYTASVPKYALPIIGKLNASGLISHCLFRNHCSICNNTFVKDLSLLGRDLSKTVIIDNSPSAYALQPENAIPIKTWTGDQSDKELMRLIPILKELNSAHDVRDYIQKNIRSAKLNSPHLRCPYNNSSNGESIFKQTNSFSTFSEDIDVFKIRPQLIPIRVRLNKGGIQFPKSFESRNVVPTAKTIKSNTKIVAFVDNKPAKYCETQLDAATSYKHSLEYRIVTTHTLKAPTLISYKRRVRQKDLARPSTSCCGRVIQKTNECKEKVRTNGANRVVSIAKNSAMKSPIYFTETRTRSFDAKTRVGFAFTYGAH